MLKSTALDSTGDTIEKNRWDESATYFSHLDALEAEALLTLRSFIRRQKFRRSPTFGLQSVPSGDPQCQDSCRL